MAARTRVQLLDEIRDRGDFPSANYPDSVEGYRIVNQSIRALEAMIASESPEWRLTSAPITIVGGTASYPLPTGLLSLVAVQAQLDGTGGRWINLRRFMLQDIAFSGEATSWTSMSHPPTYRVMGETIMFDPPPGSAGIPVRVWYIPGPTELDDDVKTYDAGVPGWDEWLVVDGVMKLREKEQTDVSELAARKAELRNDILAFVPKRDQGAPERTIDVIGGLPGEDDWESVLG